MVDPMLWTYESAADRANRLRSQPPPAPPQSGYDRWSAEVDASLGPAPAPSPEGPLATPTSGGGFGNALISRVRDIGAALQGGSQVTPTSISLAHQFPERARTGFPGGYTPAEQAAAESSRAQAEQPMAHSLANPVTDILQQKIGQYPGGNLLSGLAGGVADAATLGALSGAGGTNTDVTDPRLLAEAGMAAGNAALMGGPGGMVRSILNPARETAMGVLGSRLAGRLGGGTAARLGATGAVGAGIGAGFGVGSELANGQFDLRNIGKQTLLGGVLAAGPAAVGEGIRSLRTPGNPLVEGSGIGPALRQGAVPGAGMIHADMPQAPAILNALDEHGIHYGVEADGTIRVTDPAKALDYAAQMEQQHLQNIVGTRTLGGGGAKDVLEFGSPERAARDAARKSAGTFGNKSTKTAPNATLADYKALDDAERIREAVDPTYYADPSTEAIRTPFQPGDVLTGHETLPPEDRAMYEANAKKAQAGTPAGERDNVQAAAARAIGQDDADRFAQSLIDKGFTPRATALEIEKELVRQGFVISEKNPKITYQEIAYRAHLREIATELETQGHAAVTNTGGTLHGAPTPETAAGPVAPVAGLAGDLQPPVPGAGEVAGPPAQADIFGGSEAVKPSGVGGEQGALGMGAGTFVPPGQTQFLDQVPVVRPGETPVVPPPETTAAAPVLPGGAAPPSGPPASPPPPGNVPPGGGPVDSSGQPRFVPERGTTAAEQALTDKQAMDTAGQIPRAMQRWMPIRKMSAFANPSMDMAPEVVNAVRAEGGVRSMLQTQFTTALKPLVDSVKAAITADPPKYIGETGTKAQNALIGTAKDILDRPSQYAISPELRQAMDTYDRAQWDQVSAYVRENFGIDVAPYQGEPGSVYTPNVPTRGSDEVKLDAASKSVAMSSSTKQRAYESAWDRVGNDPKFSPETDLTQLTTMHNKAMANNAANATFQMGAGGLTRNEVVDALHPSIRPAKDAVRNALNNAQARLTTAIRQQSGTIRDFRTTASEQRAVAAKMDPLQARIDGLGAEYGPELSYLSGQVHELRLRAAALDRIGAATGPKVVGAGAKVDTLTNSVDALQSRLTDLVKAYQTAGTGDYVFDRNTSRYYTPDVAKSVAEVKRVPTGFTKQLVNVLDEIRALHFAGDASPFTIQGVLGVLTDPVSGVHQVKSILSETGKQRIARLAAENPADVAQYSFSMNKPFGVAGEEFPTHKGIGRIPKMGALEDNMFAHVEAQSFELWRQQRDMLLKDNPGMTQNEAAHAAAAITQETIPQIDPTRRAISPLRAGIERGALTSVSFATSPAMLLKDATTGLVKLGLGGTATREGLWNTLTPREQLAVRRALTIAASTSAISLASAAASAQSRNISVQDALKEAMNPSSRYFSAIQLGGGRAVPIGGPLRSFIKAMAPDHNGVPMGGFGSYVASRINSVPKGLMDLYKNQDYYGNAIRSGNIGAQALQSLWYAGEQVLPLAPGQVLTDIRTGSLSAGHTALGVISQELGTNYSGPSPTESLNQIARSRGQADFASAPYSMQQEIKAGNPELWQQKVAQSSALSQKYEAARVQSTKEQEQSDAQLLSGKITREVWKSQMDDRRQRLIGVGQGVFGETPITDPKTPEQRYTKIIQQNTDPAGAVNWDNVDTAVAALSQDDQNYIADRQGVGNTPVMQQYKAAAKQRSEMFALPKYIGFNADQARSIDDLWTQARSNSRTADAGQMLSALARITAGQNIDPKILAGARRRIVGTLTTLKGRENYAKTHPLMTSFFGGNGKAGQLTDAEKALVGQ